MLCCQLEKEQTELSSDTLCPSTLQSPCLSSTRLKVHHSHRKVESTDWIMDRTALLVTNRREMHCALLYDRKFYMLHVTLIIRFIEAFNARVRAAIFLISEM